MLTVHFQDSVAEKILRQNELKYGLPVCSVLWFVDDVVVMTLVISAKSRSSFMRDLLFVFSLLLHLFFCSRCPIYRTMSVKKFNHLNTSRLIPVATQNASIANLSSS